MQTLRDIKGIGKVMEARLLSGGIRTPMDLLRTFPCRYETHRIASLSEALPGQEITLAGTVFRDPTVAYIRRRLTKMAFELQVGTAILKVAIFNREFLRSSLRPGTEAVVTGRLEGDRIRFLASDVQLRIHYREGILPVYRFPGVGDGTFSKWVGGALSGLGADLEDDIPGFLLQKNNLPSLRGFFEIVHLPRNEEDIAAATLRIKYEDLFRFALKVRCLKKLNGQVAVPPKHYDIAKVRDFIAGLPFELTPDQKEATNDIFRDLKQPRQMMRLLQGDVGSGKTIVAALAALAVVTAGEQVAVMAPTEILARQHHATFEGLLAPFGVKTAFLSASVKGKERETVVSGLRDGSVQLVCGTHSLIQDPIRFRRLGLAVVDEQHRFGVVQRRALREKGLSPDVLFMSATPIPRTLAIAMFGDMDVSSIRTMPAGRKPVETKVWDFSHYEAMVREMRTELEKGRQAYLIVPRIETAEDGDWADVGRAEKELRGELPERFPIASLHGRMSGEDKARILRDFASGAVSVLVSTTVVEVGVNVPNASYMAVLDCDRFGLSQLHQLRGRVGRGGDQAHCRFLTDAILEGENRFRILEETTDGFLISEEDLRQRGPGEVFGEEQTGIPRFRMANPITDRALLEIAFADADLTFESRDPVARRLVEATFFAIEETNLD